MKLLTSEHASTASEGETSNATATSSVDYLALSKNTI